MLKMHGYEVCAAATVAEALAEITTHPYDILVSDLNIGEAGDGFTVVSAMRRTQPDCINLIFTGFPAFESALAAIRGQVDDYVIKPARAGQLVNLIQEKMRNRNPRRSVQLVRLSKLLRETVQEIREHTLARMKSDPTLGSIEMSDEQRVGYLARIVIEIANQMDSPQPDEPVLAFESGREHGLQRLSAGYKISMLVTDSAILDAVVFDIVRERLLSLDTSNLMLDLKRFNLGLRAHVERSVQAFCDEASRPRSKERRAG
jgi:ActR/RegA family two-component response regulator